MVTLTTGADFAARLDQLYASDLNDGDVTTATSTTIAINTGDGYLDTFTGNFTYTNGEPSGGTITGYQFTQNGDVILTATGANVDAGAFINDVHNEDTSALLSLFFANDDSMSGGTHDDYLAGFGGNDNIYGGAGADTLIGGDANDHLYGQSSTGGSDGADTLSGGNGDDYLQGNAGADTIDGGSGQDRIFGGADNDTITGGDGNDTINGNKGDDHIDAGAGNDTARGGQGNDILIGGDGNDVLNGDLGSDTLHGGTGIDVLTGGGDNDTFTFSAGDASFTTTGTLANYVDEITDFTRGTDHIGLGFTISSVLTGQADSFGAAQSVAQSLLNGHTNAVADIQVGSDSYLFYSGTGGSAIDSAIKLDTVTSVAASDFV